MKARPILFKIPMVQAILDGRKTQTRLVIKPQPRFENGVYFFPERNTTGYGKGIINPLAKEWLQECPYGTIGDLLWVRESFICGYDLDQNGNKICTDDEGNDLPSKVWYAVDGDIQWTDDNGYQCNTPWKPSIHMPRWASRITLEITDIRAERLQDISEDDAMAEGVDKMFPPDTSKKTPEYYRIPFAVLWESINGVGAWDANPWVWAITFKPHMMNVDEFIGLKGEL